MIIMNKRRYKIIFIKIKINLTPIQYNIVVTVCKVVFNFYIKTVFQLNYNHFFISSCITITKNQIPTSLHGFFLLTMFFNPSPEVCQQ